MQGKAPQNYNDELLYFYHLYIWFASLYFILGTISLYIITTLFDPAVSLWVYFFFFTLQPEREREI